MDLSKLPRLSKTDTPPPESTPGDSYSAPTTPAGYPARPPPEPQYTDDTVGTFMDIWLSAGFGLLFVLLGLNYGRYLYTTMSGGQYSTGFVWSEGTAKAGEPVRVDEL